MDCAPLNAVFVESYPVIVFLIQAVDYYRTGNLDCLTPHLSCPLFSSGIAISKDRIIDLFVARVTAGWNLDGSYRFSLGRSFLTNNRTLDTTFDNSRLKL